MNVTFHNKEPLMQNLYSFFRWLSKGRALQEIEQFLGEIGGNAAESCVEILRSEDSMRDMAFITDILIRLND